MISLGELVSIGVMIPKDKKEQLRELANQKGMGLSSMVRNWLYDRYSKETEEDEARPS